MIHALSQSISLSHTRFTQDSKLTIDHAEMWYFRVLSTEKAEAKCSKAGDYLVRYNLQHGKYTLTVKSKSGIHLHILIQETADVSCMPLSYLLSLCSFLLCRGRSHGHTVVCSFVCVCSQCVSRQPLATEC